MSSHPKPDKPQPATRRKDGATKLPAAPRKLAVQSAKQIRDSHGLLDRETAQQLSRLVRASGPIRSRFRNEVDQDSGLMPISVPRPSRSVIGAGWNSDRERGIG